MRKCCRQEKVKEVAWSWACLNFMNGWSELSAVEMAEVNRIVRRCGGVVLVDETGNDVFPRLGY